MRGPPLLVRLAGVVLLSAGAGCRSLLEPGTRVTLGITDVQAPATFEAGQLFTVTLTVVTGGCRSFERFDAVRAPDRLTLSAVGRDRSGPDVACPADIRQEPHEYTARPPFADSVVVVAAQPELIEIRRVARRR